MTTESAAPETTIETQDQEHVETQATYVPGLFEDEAEFSSEEELTGGEEAEAEAETESENLEEGKGQESSAKPPEPADPKDAKPEAKPEADAKPEEKPPAGYVPKQALDEERHKRQSLSSELYQAKAKIAELESRTAKASAEKPGQESADEFKDFKVLSQQEFDELVEDDPIEAQKYQRKETRFIEHQRAKEREERSKREFEAVQNQVLQEAVDEIDHVAPGIWDPKTGVGKELTATAEKFGISKQVASVMSNPGTIILDQKTGQQFILGSGAVEFVRLVKSVADFAKNNDPEALKKKLETEIENSRAESIVRKIKTGSTGPVSLGDASSHNESIDGSVPDDEDSFARLPDDVRRKALGG